MKQKNIILYIAASLDGYIATENDDLGFLSTVERPGEDYGYFDFVKTVDTVIMGRRTYDKVLSFGIEFPHKDKTCYVVSRSRSGSDGNVTFYNGDLTELIARIRQNEGKDVFIDGGSELTFELMKLGLIDRYIISMIPVMLGGGIPLFRPGREEQKLTLMECKTFPSGLVQLCYEKA